MKTIDNCDSYFNFFPYIILKADSFPDKTRTFIWLDNLSTSPNHIMLNEYIILPFFQDLDWKDEDDFFELKNELEMNDLLNVCYEEVKVGIISNERYDEIIETINNEAAKKRVIELLLRIKDHLSN